MSGKFQNVPIEKGTRIHFEKEIKIGTMNVLHQVWSWDGVHAESIIFHNEDVLLHTEDEVKEIVVGHFKDGLQKNFKMTISRSDSGFTFVNFNFTY